MIFRTFDIPEKLDQTYSHPPPGASLGLSLVEDKSRPSQLSRAKGAECGRNLFISWTRLSSLDACLSGMCINFTVDGRMNPVSKRSLWMEQRNSAQLASLKHS